MQGVYQCLPLHLKAEVVKVHSVSPYPGGGNQTCERKTALLSSLTSHLLQDFPRHVQRPDCLFAAY